MKTFCILGLSSLGLLLSNADPALAQRGGAVRGGVRGAAVGGMVGGEQAAKVGAVVGATRGAVNRETQARAQYYANPAYQTTPRSDFNTAPPQVLATTAPAAVAATSGGEAVLRAGGKPVVAITFPQDWKQSASDTLVSAISPDGQAWAGLGLLQGAADQQAGINKIKEGLSNHLSNIQYDEPTENKTGALVITGSGKGKKAGVDVVFAAGVFEAAKGQLAAAAFVVDSKIEDHYKDTVHSICETIRKSDTLAK